MENVNLLLEVLGSLIEAKKAMASVSESGARDWISSVILGVVEEIREELNIDPKEIMVWPK